MLMACDSLFHMLRGVNSRLGLNGGKEIKRANQLSCSVGIRTGRRFTVLPRRTRPTAERKAIIGGGP